ncbi:hypothetical protein [Dyadobacter fermentans]|uniref:Uncharacterized protein n=1 Tax=Dyadobacter fermentans (strain ATCC 700827 / DSM 18053 / CIP 107007 / KCTC 52180 / NS114) TaxID=471854 RepID=C6W667_DYAFD|nr:hypothetical protein [Dyadobacter fermentans]ACT92547.1 hypothetical protein Dfer_1299 [Dyadobacter fermentans DSM 18053]
MEIHHHQQRTRSYRYVVYLVLAAIAAGISIYFYAPKPVNEAANESMSLFLQNKISDIDTKLKNGDADTDLATRLSWHKSNTALYDEAKSNNDKKIVGQRELLKKKMVQVQQRDFPELRTAYVESKKEALDGQHVAIGLSGTHQEVLTFEGDIFKPEQVQEDFMKNIYGIVNDLRFKKVVYKWSDAPDGHHNYEIKSKQDAEI